MESVHWCGQGRDLLRRTTSVFRHFLKRASDVTSKFLRGKFGVTVLGYQRLNERQGARHGLPSKCWHLVTSMEVDPRLASFQVPGLLIQPQGSSDDLDFSISGTYETR